MTKKFISLFKNLEEENTKNLIEKLLNSFHFVKSVKVLSHNEHFRTHKDKDVDCKVFFYKVKTNLLNFLSKEFLQQLKLFNVSCISLNDSIDVGNVFCILPNGTLILNLNKDTYETLGLEGKSSTLIRRSDRFVVKINLLDASFTETKKFYQRVKWCFENSLVTSFNFFLTKYNKSNGNLEELDNFGDANIEKVYLNDNYLCNENVITPHIEQILEQLTRSSDLKQSESTELINDLLEWLGMAAVSSDRIMSYDRVDSFISAYKVAQPNRIHNLYSMEATGLISVSTIINIFRNLCDELLLKKAINFGVLYLWGFRDSPVSFNQKEHGFNLTDGENDLVLVLSDAGDAVLVQVLGDLDEYSR
ncbi:Ribonuclease P protein subunit p40 [Clydaea vesicula]|uniref:Ribonuclease P protein subunit p40 n=1 Tax=Clydaea vesicula TaxID=447962 RepID=A0AAD5U3B6_9FUNG|nr:Ribonuclease P protein subunit p40 [Clydaea vesicula]